MTAGAKIDPMHEYSVARVLLNQVEVLARRLNRGPATAIHVSIGEFSGIEGDLLEMAFQQLCAESPLAGTRLVVRRIPLEAECEECGIPFEVQAFHFVCPRCESRQVKIVRGEELMLDSVAFREQGT